MRILPLSESVVFGMLVAMLADFVRGGPAPSAHFMTVALLGAIAYRLNYLDER